MDNIIEVDIFFEDRMQVELVKPIISRISVEHDVYPDISEKSVASSNHGKGDKIQDLKNYLKLFKKNFPSFRIPDVLVVAVDSNCDSFQETKESVIEIINKEIVPYFVVACPYPHVEKWYLNDLECFNRIVGFSPSVPLEKC